MAKIEFRFLNRDEVQELMPPVKTLLDVVERGLTAHGAREVVLPPKSHIDLDDRYNGHFNILVGWSGPIDTAGVKVVGDYVDNYLQGLPSEVAMLTLYEPSIGIPIALMDATDITTHRTGAVSGVGARHLARRDSKVVGHIGARGTAFSNIAALAELFELKEVRLTSKRPETREELVRRLREELSVNAVPCSSVEETVQNADIVIEATRLEKPAVLIRDEWLKDDCLLITYGWVMAVDPKTVKRASKIIVDDWEQCCKGGQLYPLIESGDLTRDDIYSEIGQITSGQKAGRTEDDGLVIFWHRGFAISDIMLGHHIYGEAERKGIGQVLTLFDRGDESLR